MNEHQKREIERIKREYADLPRVRDAVIARLTDAWSEKTTPAEPTPAMIRQRAAALIEQGQSTADAERNATRAAYYAAGLTPPVEVMTAAELQANINVEDITGSRANDEARTAEREEKWAVTAADMDEYDRAHPGVSVERGNLSAQRQRMVADKAGWIDRKAKELAPNYPNAEQWQIVQQAEGLFGREVAGIDGQIAAISAEIRAESEA